MNAHRCLSLCVAAVLLAGGLVVAQDAAKDLKALQGTWELTDYTVDGKAVPAKALKGFTFVFDGDMLTQTPPDGKSQKVTYKLDPGKKPKAIDVTQKGKTGLGIYELDGDKLKLCVAMREGSGRPKTFESKEDSKVALFVLKRVKKGS